MSRTTWVFLRGLVRQHQHWEAFPRQFQAAFPEAQLVLPDTPGNGDLHDHESPTSIAAMVESIREQVQAQGVTGPVHLLAVSMGAMIGIEWMERHPEEIERAVLINTSVRGLNPLMQRLRRENWLDILKSLVFHSSVERERFILDLTSNLYPDKDGLARKWAAYAKSQPTSRLNAMRQLLAAATYHAPAARPHEHVLLLQSLGDHIVDPVCTTRIAESWRWPLVSHPTAGHDLTLDDGPWVVEQVRHWLAGAGASA